MHKGAALGAPAHRGAGPPPAAPRPDARPAVSLAQHICEERQLEPTCTISSTRFRNSGRKWWRTTSITAALASAPLPRSSRMLAPWRESREVGVCLAGDWGAADSGQRRVPVPVPQRLCTVRFKDSIAPAAPLSSPTPPQSGPGLAVHTVSGPPHQVAGHDDERVVEGYGAPLGVRQPAAAAGQGGARQRNTWARQQGMQGGPTAGSEAAPGRHRRWLQPGRRCWTAPCCQCAQRDVYHVGMPKFKNFDSHTARRPARPAGCSSPANPVAPQHMGTARSPPVVQHAQ